MKMPTAMEEKANQDEKALDGHRPVDINSIVGWLLMTGDGYIRTCATAILQSSLIPHGQARDLWFEIDRQSGRLVGTLESAGRRMEQAWMEPWPQHLVIVHFKGALSTLRMTSSECGVGGWADLVGSDVGPGGEWPYRTASVASDAS